VGLLRLRPQPVAASVATALTPGLAVLSGLAMVTR